MSSNRYSKARRLALLGLILQSLHVLFGFTAVMGMFINHMLIDQSKDTIYHSQLRWQLITFWVSAALYTVAFIIWRNYALGWPAIAVFTFTLYRIGVGIYYFKAEQPLDRII